MTPFKLTGPQRSTLLTSAIVVATLCLTKAAAKHVPYSTPSSYPLDPLTAHEIRAAALIIRAAYPTLSLKFLCIGLKEPDKSCLLPYFLSGKNPHNGEIYRRAEVLVVDPAYEDPMLIVVNLDTKAIESRTAADPDQQTPTITVEEQNAATVIIFTDPAVLDRFKNLGFNDPNNTIVTDVWQAGYVADDPSYAGIRKLVQVFFFAYRGNGDNYFAHPFDFVVYVDLVTQRIAGIEDLPIQNGFSRTNRAGNSVPLASTSNYFPDSLSPPNEIREDVRPIKISQPEGVSYHVEGRMVTWQNFRFHVGYGSREGLLINHVTYNDYDTVRPLFYRLSVSETFVYYGDPRPPYHRKISFDEAAFAFTSTTPISSQFCRGSAVYFDFVVHDDKAVPSVIKNSTCIFEEDAGLLWAHYDSASDRTAVTRSQRLCVSSLISIGNIDYYLSWRFYQDATVELSVRLTGVLHTSLLAVDVKAPPYGSLVTSQVYAQNYQYLIAARIDADIDGVRNTVSMEDIVSVSPTKNPYGNGITTKSKVFRQVKDAPSDIKPGRTWRVSNPSVDPNYVSGKQPSWKLIPQGPNMPNLLRPYSPYREPDISYGDHNMWVLPFDNNEMFAAGVYLDGGVSQWTNDSLTDNLENTDVVLWHVFGLAYTPDPEDWPVVSSIPDTVGFKLRPSNFFYQNPAVTVPPASQTTAYDDN